jgi:nicotinate-nucleotide pyrophosphorylase (carboxylating)
LPLARADVARALQEDLGSGDLTAALVPEGRRCRARILAREAAVICGAPWAEAALRALDPTVSLTWLVAEGQRCAPDQVVLEIAGDARALLAERTALNFLQLLSAVATKTAIYVEAVHARAIVDTRKTIPACAWRKVRRARGRRNHRIGLHDAVLIKENHIAAAGGVTPCCARPRPRRRAPPSSRSRWRRWSSCQALDAGAKMVLLDNMDLPTLREAVKSTPGAPS